MIVVLTQAIQVMSKQSYLDSHFPFNQTKVKIGLDKIERGWVGFWQFKGNQKHRYQAQLMQRKLKWLPIAND